MIDCRRLIACALLVLFAGSAMADANWRDEGGRTPLHHAAARGTPANIAALLDAGADIAARDKGGRTPLDLANDRTDSNAAAKMLRKAMQRRGR